MKSFKHVLTNLAYSIASCSGLRFVSSLTLTTSPTTAKQEENIKSPATGINTYYLALTILAVFLSGGLYIINKKNLFKKI